MNPPTKEVERVFHAVAEVAPDARSRLLSDLCGEDGALRGAVEKLLLHDTDDADFLDRPALGERVDLSGFSGPAEELVGRRLGAYRLVKHLATGGMGVVFQATRADDQFQKTVAIKLLRHIVDEASIRRFRGERQTLADFDHPNIARLLDGGVADDSTPYLVMEFIEGESVDEYCRRRNLSVDERLDLFLTICGAVEYSHAKLVVHRDLKPGNILVTADGTVKLLDFGVAKVLDESKPEAAGTPGFTPQYASPEQVAGGPITTATDVYALGLLLYELLSDEQPFAFDTLSTKEIKRTIREVDPAPPSEVAKPGMRRRLRGDLDAIVLKAASKEPEARYGSVARLAEDVERHRRYRPVVARAPTLAYRARRALRRNWTGILIGGVLVASITAGALGTLWKADEAARERDTAEETLRFLDDVLSSAQPGSYEYTIAEAIESAAERLTTELQDKPRVRTAIHTTIARAYLSLGRYTEAEKHFRDAIKEALVTGQPDSPFVLERTGELAVVLHAAAKLEEAERILRKGLASCLKTLGSSALLTAQYENNLAAVVARLGNNEEARELYGRALATREAELGPMDLLIAETRTNLSGLARANKEFDEAIEQAEAALEIRRTRLEGGHPLVLQSLTNVAVLLCEQGTPDAVANAEALLVEAAERARLTFGGNHPDLGAHLGALGAFYATTERAELGEPLLTEAVKLYRKHLPIGHPRTIKIGIHLAHCWIHLGRYARAERLLAQLTREVPEGNASHDLGLIESRIVLYRAWKRPKQAAAWHAKRDAMLEIPR